MKVLSYGIGKKFYGGKYSDNMLLSVEVIAAFPAGTSMSINCKKRFHAKNGFIVEYGWQKNFKDENKQLEIIKTLIEKIKQESETSPKPEFGVKKNCGHYIVINDEKLYVNPTENWTQLSVVLGLDHFAKQDPIESLKKIYETND